MRKQCAAFLLRSVILCFCLIAVYSCGDDDTGNVTDTSEVVETNYGKVMGYTDRANNISIWKSIPYAKPPVGELRWRAPQDPEPWTEIRDATEDCSPCVQNKTDLVTSTHTITGSEDCLYLNIYRPNSQDSNLPVYVFIHGGANTAGAINDYNLLAPSVVKKSNVVFETFQYRLGPFGWLTHPDMREGKDSLDASGNFGNLDMIKALEWINENIEAFGGNPDNVLLSGESAGGHNVLSCVASPLAKGLFHKAMSQSAMGKSIPVDEADQNCEDFILRLMDRDGSMDYPEDVEAYLRGKTAYELIEGFGNANEYVDKNSATPCEDGTVIPEVGEIASFQAGHYNKVPIILGSNRYEMKLILPSFSTFLKTAYLDYPEIGITDPIPSGSYTWGDIFGAAFGDLAVDDVLPTQDDKALYEACAVGGSLMWRYNFVDHIARTLSEHQDEVYTYLFSWDGPDGSPYNFCLGAAHFEDIQFFFGSGFHFISGGRVFNVNHDTHGRKALSEAMMEYIKNFAHTEIPQCDHLPDWNRWSNQDGEDKSIVFDADETDVDIHMINEETTSDQVESKFIELYSSLPESTRNALYFFKWY